MRKSFIVVFLILILGVCGALLDPLPSQPKREIAEVLRQTQRIEALRLNPELVRDDPASVAGYRVLGRRELSEAEREQALAALESDFRYRVWEVARSFKPIDGLALHAPKGDYQLLISYECFQMKLVRPDGSYGPLVPLGGSSAGVVQGLVQSITPTP